jgi:hypothetical protein
LPARNMGIQLNDYIISQQTKNWFLNPGGYAWDWT